MKQKKNRTHYIVLGLYGMTALCLTASISGTFAWYTYSTRTGLTFEGASVSDAGSLHIGILSRNRDKEYAAYGFEEEYVAEIGQYIYWSYNGLTAARINHIIGMNGSATNKLHQVTSGKYHGSDFKLYDTPMHGSNYIADSNTNSETRIAPSNYYVNLPLAFRYGDEDNPGEYRSGKNIYMTECKVKSATNVGEGVRIFSYHHSLADGYLINPTEDIDGYDEVGGLLNLDKDIYYDTWTNPDTKKTYEYPYGEFVDGHYEYENEPLTSSTDIERSDITTFYANHKAGTYALNMEKSIPETSEYKGMSNFLNHRIAMSTTDDVKNYALLNLMIYLEGWDESMINAEIDNEFSMDFTFEMD